LDIYSFLEKIFLPLVHLVDQTSHYLQSYDGLIQIACAGILEQYGHSIVANDVSLMRLDSRIFSTNFNISLDKVERLDKVSLDRGEVPVDVHQQLALEDVEDVVVLLGGVRRRRVKHLLEEVHGEPGDFKALLNEDRGVLRLLEALPMS
jgi:hypothetical protein